MDMAEKSFNTEIPSFGGRVERYAGKPAYGSQDLPQWRVLCFIKSSKMGFFSKKITKNQIADSLVGTFAMCRDGLVKGMASLLKENATITNEQDHEIMMVAMLAVIHAIHTTFGKEEMGKYIIGKFQDNIFKGYLFSDKEREEFKIKFWERCNEYYKILSSENKDLDIQFGQIFCTYFFGKEEDGSHVAIMMFIGGAFLHQTVQVKNFLDEIISKFTII